MHEQPYHFQMSICRNVSKIYNSYWFSLTRKVIKGSGDVFGRVSIRCVADHQTGFTDRSVSEQDALQQPLLRFSRPDGFGLVRRHRGCHGPTVVHADWWWRAIDPDFTSTSSVARRGAHHEDGGLSLSLLTPSDKARLVRKSSLFAQLAVRSRRPSQQQRWVALFKARAGQRRLLICLIPPPICICIKKISWNNKDISCNAVGTLTQTSPPLSDSLVPFNYLILTC